MVKIWVYLNITNYWESPLILKQSQWALASRILNHWIYKLTQYLTIWEWDLKIFFLNYNIVVFIFICIPRFKLPENSVFTQNLTITIRHVCCANLILKLKCYYSETSGKSGRILKHVKPENFNLSFFIVTGEPSRPWCQGFSLCIPLESLSTTRLLSSKNWIVLGCT